MMKTRWWWARHKLRRQLKLNVECKSYFFVWLGVFSSRIDVLVFLGFWLMNCPYMPEIVSILRLCWEEDLSIFTHLYLWEAFWLFQSHHFNVEKSNYCIHVFVKWKMVIDMLRKKTEGMLVRNKGEEDHVNDRMVLFWTCQFLVRAW